MRKTAFKDKWGDTKLWSHDLSHHRRVWDYAKELLPYAGDTDQFFIEKLLIACYLHDIGMSIDPGEKHGIRSRMICELFLKENKIFTRPFFDPLSSLKAYAHLASDRNHKQINKQISSAIHLQKYFCDCCSFFL